MRELEENIRSRETADLQNAIRNNQLNPETAVLAAKVLAERGAAIPIPKTDAEVEAEEKAVRRESGRKFLFVVIGILMWIAFAAFTDMFSDVSRMNKSIFAMGLYLYLSLRDWKKPVPTQAATPVPVKRRRKVKFLDAIFLSPMLTRISWALAIAALFRMVMLGLSLNGVQPQWQALKTDYNRWRASGKGPVCEKMFAGARAEVEALPNCDVLERMRSIGSTECVTQNEHKWVEVSQRLKGSGCPQSSGNPYDPIVEQMMREQRLPSTPRSSKQVDLPSYVPPHDPGTLWAYAREDNPEKMVTQVLVIAATIFGFTILGKSFLLIGHKGWQRLTLVASLAAGGIAAAISYFSHPYRWPGYIFNHFFATTLAVFVSLLYGRRLVLWVREGFHDTKPVQATSIDDSKSARESIPAAVASANPDESEVDDTSGKPLATFWPRFWARCIDLSLTWLLANVFIMFVPDIGGVFPTWIGFMVNIAVWVVVMGLAVLAYDTLWISKTGTTPGKAWFGLAVRDPDGFIPDSTFAFRRSWGFLSTGMVFMLFFPFVQVFTAKNAAKTLKNGGTQLGWDFAGRTFVHQNPVGAFRFLTGATFGALLIGGLVVTSRMAQEDQKKEITELVIHK